MIADLGFAAVAVCPAYRRTGRYGHYHVPGFLSGFWRVADGGGVSAPMMRVARVIGGMRVLARRRTSTVYSYMSSAITPRRSCRASGRTILPRRCHEGAPID